MLLTTLFLCFCSCNGASILGVFHSFSKSHNIIGEVILKKLAEKGHDVTMVTGFPLKKVPPNYKQIVVPEAKQINDENEVLLKEFLKRGNMFDFQNWHKFENHTMVSTESVFKNEEFKTLLSSGKKIDLILIDLFFNDAHFALNYVFNAPIIAVATGGSNDVSNSLVGNPAPYSYVPSKFLPYSDEMTFLQRMTNTLLSLLMESFISKDNKYEAIVQKYYSEAPPLSQLKENVALVFSNAHVSYESPRPYIPSVINIGGCHVQDPEPLPMDIKKYLDDAVEGAIFFSMGSNLKSTYIEADKINAILNAFKSSKLKVLMKWETDVLPNKPDNVKVGKWLPQNSILAHPNVKAFITHGGLMSTIESLYHGVPIIGLPIYADQKYNVPQAVLAGYGIELDFTTLTEDNLLSAIIEITSNKKYSESIKKKSELLKNQPIKPIDLAVYWAEHVIRYKGADHLKTKANTLKWYQLLLLDVFGVIAAVLMTFVAATYFTLKKLLGLCFRRKRSEKSSKKSKKVN